MRGVPETMRAAAIDRFGGPEVLTVRTVPVPEPDSGEVHFTRAFFYYQSSRDYAAALQELALAKPNLPNSAEVPYFAGIIERRPRTDGKGTEYHLTPAGEELGPVLAQIGIWSERWLRRPIFEETPDTGLLMWWMRGTVKTDALPARRTVIHFAFRGAPEKLRYFWLVLPEADLCLSDPGFGVDITVRSDPKTLTAVWMGDLGVAEALSAQSIELEGPRTLVRSFPKWFGLHPLSASVKHPASRPRVTA